MIEAKIVADSIAPTGIRLTTFVLTYPRFIHAEFMTHRMFSRNASSSRAIPVKRSIQMVLENPAIPLAFTKNQKGMQGGDPLDEKASRLAEQVWMHALFHAVDKAKMLADLDVHKQYANRILEPFSHITVVCTATEYANFFALRYHSMAQPEICELAKQMWTAYQANTPEEIELGSYHLPFVNEEDWKYVGIYHSEKPMEHLIKMSVARCARVSYLNHEGKKPSFEEDMQLYDRLLGGVPIHASPAEHQAQCTAASYFVGNFKGWAQYRKTLQGENIEKFDGPSDN